MRQIRRTDLPKDFFYYRSHSATYFSWILHNARKHGSESIEEDGFYALVKRFFWGAFSMAYFEKCDFEPTAKALAKHGFKRGLVFWSPWRKAEPKSNGWRKLPFFVSHAYHHATRSAFSILEPEYWKKWKPWPRGHRNSLRKSLESWEIRIDTWASLESFLAAYEKTALPHDWKGYLVARQKFLSGQNDGNIRIYLASINGEVLAGAIFLDDFPTSTYLVAFQEPSAKRHHLWLALVDRWFEESLSKGFKYLDFDHMRDAFDPASYAGYTEFKSGLADYDARFENVWVRWFP
jgi:hypothetical protein